MSTTLCWEGAGKRGATAKTPQFRRIGDKRRHTCSLQETLPPAGRLKRAA